MNDSIRERNRKAIPLILTFSIMVVIGQNLMKHGMGMTPEFENLTELFGILFQVIFNPWVFSGLLLYVFSTGIWLIVLSRTGLSFCYPFISISYVLIIISARIFQNELIDIYKAVGVTLIILGVIMLSMSQTADTPNPAQSESDTAKSPEDA